MLNFIRSLKQLNMKNYETNIKLWRTFSMVVAAAELHTTRNIKNAGNTILYLDICCELPRAFDIARLSSLAETNILAISG
jgi:hypothetical protein